MKRSELIKLLSIISNSYPGKFEFPRETKEETELLLETWYAMLRDYDYAEAKRAYSQYIIKKPAWPPTLGEIIAEIQQSQQGGELNLTSGEAWKLALDAVRKYGIYQAGKAMASLPPLVQDTIQCLGGYEYLCHSEIDNTFIRSNFIKFFEELKAKKKAITSLPPSHFEELLDGD